MRVNKAKRKLMKWERYHYRINKITTQPSHLYKGFIYVPAPRYHHGHAEAYSDVMYAHRWAPNGIREPHRTRWMVQ